MAFVEDKQKLSLRNTFISKELIEALDAYIPHRCPDLNAEERAIWAYKGMRDVVDLLICYHNEQQQSTKEL